LKLPKRNSFVVGFVTALVLWGAGYLWSQMEWSGGLHSKSPTGSHEVVVMGPLSPASGGSYTVELIESRTSAVLRHLVITVPRTEETVALREGGGAIVWDAVGKSADVTAGGSYLVRVYVP
jgi:hypothetical protein